MSWPRRGVEAGAVVLAGAGALLLSLGLAPISSPATADAALSPVAARPTDSGSASPGSSFAETSLPDRETLGREILDGDTLNGGTPQGDALAGDSTGGDTPGSSDAGRGGNDGSRAGGNGATNGPEALGRSRPERLSIPAIGVDTKVSELGLQADGTVEVPPLTARAPAGWYRYLASPGEVGPAVLLGHVDSARDGPAVFFRLGQLRPGNEVVVDRADGTRAVFTVTDVQRHPKSEFPTQTVYGHLDRPGLRLVTCGGTFDRAAGSYRENVVVLAELTGTGSTPIGAK